VSFVKIGSLPFRLSLYFDSYNFIRIHTAAHQPKTALLECKLFLFSSYVLVLECKPTSGYNETYTGLHSSRNT
jgi:hypothetical protein